MTFIPTLRALPAKRASLAGLCALSLTCATLTLTTTTTAAAASAPTKPTSFSVTSFDGTIIKGYFFKTGSAGHRAPSVLKGPGWGGLAVTDPAEQTDTNIGSVGVGPLLQAGYNVVTWNPRGFGTSGGRAELDDPYHEGRDVSAILDWLARQPQAQLDRRGDPRVGMVGGSYGGTVQLAAAAVDHRMDAITPDISWNSLASSVDTNNTARSGWLALLGAGAQAAGQRDDPRVDEFLTHSQASFRLPAADVHFLASRGPNYLLSQISTPTLLLQGTVDTLFPLREAVANYRALSDSRVPVRMVWFCGGHGVCLTNPGDTSRIQTSVMTWLARYVKKLAVPTGPGFVWVDQLGNSHTSDRYPVTASGQVSAEGSGSLELLSTGGSGPYTGPLPAGVAPPNALVTATPAQNAVNVPIRFPAETEVLGVPQLTVTYNGRAPEKNARVLAQIVDDNKQVVLGSQLTPIPVVLDGQRHTLTLPLEILAAAAKRGTTFTLQIVAQSSIFNAHPAGGMIDFLHIKVSVPTIPYPAQ